MLGALVVEVIVGGLALGGAGAGRVGGLDRGGKAEVLAAAATLNVAGAISRFSIGTTGGIVDGGIEVAFDSTTAVVRTEVRLVCQPEIECDFQPELELLIQPEVAFDVHWEVTCDVIDGVVAFVKKVLATVAFVFHDSVSVEFLTSFDMTSVELATELFRRARGNSLSTSTGVTVTLSGLVAFSSLSVVVGRAKADSVLFW